MIVIAALLAAMQTAEPQAPLELVCTGGHGEQAGLRNRSKPSAWIGDGRGTPVSGSGYSTTTVTGMRQQGFADQVDVRLFKGDDLIRLPRTMLPAFRGGEGGWFKLKNVTATAGLSCKSCGKPDQQSQRSYDRVTGSISISGKAGDYVGQCQAVRQIARQIRSTELSR
jgi:hypothetical protein